MALDIWPTELKGYILGVMKNTMGVREKVPETLRGLLPFSHSKQALLRLNIKESKVSQGH